MRRICQKRRWGLSRRRARCECSGVLLHTIVRSDFCCPANAELEMARSPLIVGTDRGLYCPLGDFHIDAWQPVVRNIVTHAHSDHARAGSGKYLVAARGAGVLRRRLGSDIALDSLEYGEAIRINEVTVSLHPAGHVLGSAQVRVEHEGDVWVFTGDYKTQADPTCQAFELVRCNTFITECTFGLPIFGGRGMKRSRRILMGGGDKISSVGELRSCSRIRWVRRSGCWRCWTRRSGRFCCMGLFLG